MKKVLSGLLFLSIMVFIITGCEQPGGSTQTGKSEADGTVNNPFLVKDVTDLLAVGRGGDSPYDKWTIDKHYRQTADIDLTGTENWTRIEGSFSGSYDGKGFVITGMTIATGSDLGMFTTINTSGIVKNLGFVGGSISGLNYLGFIAGRSSGLIENCYSTGNITGTGYAIGGLVGANNDSGTVKNSYSTGNITSTSNNGSHAGGVVGSNTGIVINCYASGNVTGGSRNVGGVVGDNRVNPSKTNNGFVKDSISLNRIVNITTDISSVGRVVGGNEFNQVPTNNANYNSNEFENINNCFAWNGMSLRRNNNVLPDFSTGLTHKNGQNIDSAAVKTKSTWENAGFLFTDSSPVAGPWIWDSSGIYMPGLHGEQNQWLVIDDPPGSANNPFLVTSVTDLRAVGRGGASPYNDWTTDKYYEQTANIDLTGTGNWTKIDGSFIGSYDGKGHTITGLVINGTGDLGMFASVLESGVIKNLGLVSGSVTGSMYLGMLVARNSGTIENCFATGNVIGSSYAIGGLVGANNTTGVIKNCYTTGNVTSTNDNGSHLGGIAGMNTGMVINCFATGSVTGSSRNVGGIVGDNRVNPSKTNNGSVKDSIALNQIVNMTSNTSTVGRVVGGNEFNQVATSNANYNSNEFENIINCFAWSGMDLRRNNTTITGYPVGSTHKNGQDISSAEIKTKTTWTNAGFLFTDSSPVAGPWLWDNSGVNMPSLNGEQIIWPGF